MAKEKDKKGRVTGRGLAKALGIPQATFFQWQDRFFKGPSLAGAGVEVFSPDTKSIALMFVVKQLRGFWKVPLTGVEEILLQLQEAFNSEREGKKIGLVVAQVRQPGGKALTYANVVLDTPDSLTRLSASLTQAGIPHKIYDISATVRQIEEEGGLVGVRKVVDEGLKEIG